MANIIQLPFSKGWHQQLNQLIQQQLAEKVFSGIELLFASQGEILLHRSWGHLEIGDHAARLEKNTLFDVASITKPVITATAICMLLEQGKLDLEDKVNDWFPEFFSSEKQTITIRHLLSHSSGLPAWENLYEGTKNAQHAWNKLMQVPLEHPPDQQMIYSCLGFLILGELVRKITGQSLGKFATEKILHPLGMFSSGFRPNESSSLSKMQIAPTQYCNYRKQLLRGVVHDENAYIFDQEGGNAGLFSTAEDLYQFSQMVFHQGVQNDYRCLSSLSLENMTKNHNSSTILPRGLGWDIKGRNVYASCGSLFSENAIGHTGFTGTSFWLELSTQTVVILLTNRVHLSREKNLAQMRVFRPRLHNVLLSSL